MEAVTRTKGEHVCLWLSADRDLRASNLCTFAYVRRHASSASSPAQLRVRSSSSTRSVPHSSEPQRKTL